MKNPEYKISAKLAADIIEVLQGASTDETGEYNNNDNIKVLEAFQEAIRKQDEAPNAEVSGGASGRAARECGTDSANSRPLH
jgi:hypothetical protein